MSSNWKAHPCLRHGAIDSIDGTLWSDCWLQSRKSSVQQYHVIITLAAYITIDPCLLHWVRWQMTVDPDSSTFWQVFTIAEYLASPLTNDPALWQVVMSYMVLIALIEYADIKCMVRSLKLSFGLDFPTYTIWKLSIVRWITEKFV